VREKLIDAQLMAGRLVATAPKGNTVSATHRGMGQRARQKQPH